MAAPMQNPTCEKTKKRRRKSETANNNGDSKARSSRKASFMEKIVSGNNAAKVSSFLKRKPTLKKKAGELQRLSGAEVFMVCFGPDGSLDVFPDDNPAELKKQITSYKELDNRNKHVSDLVGLLQAKKEKLEKKRKEKAMKLNEIQATLSEWLRGLSGDSLKNAVNCLELTLASLNERIKSLQSAGKAQESVPVDELATWQGGCTGNSSPQELASSVNFGTTQEISALQTGIGNNVLMNGGYNSFQASSGTDFGMPMNLSEYYGNYYTKPETSIVNGVIPDTDNSSFGRPEIPELLQPEIYNGNLMQDNNFLLNNSLNSNPETSIVNGVILDTDNSSFGRPEIPELLQPEIYNGNLMQDNSFLFNNSLNSNSGLVHENLGIEIYDNNFNANQNLGIIEEENRNYSASTSAYEAPPPYDITPISVWAPPRVSVQHYNQYF